MDTICLPKMLYGTCMRQNCKLSHSMAAAVRVGFVPCKTKCGNVFDPKFNRFNSTMCPPCHARSNNKERCTTMNCTNWYNINAPLCLVCKGPNKAVIPSTARMCECGFERLLKEYPFDKCYACFINANPQLVAQNGSNSRGNHSNSSGAGVDDASHNNKRRGSVDSECDAKCDVYPDTCKRGSRCVDCTNYERKEKNCKNHYDPSIACNIMMKIRSPHDECHACRMAKLSAINIKKGLKKAKKSKAAAASSSTTASASTTSPPLLLPSSAEDVLGDEAHGGADAAAPETSPLDGVSTATNDQETVPSATPTSEETSSAEEKQQQSVVQELSEAATSLSSVASSSSASSDESLLQSTSIGVVSPGETRADHNQPKQEAVDVDQHRILALAPAVTDRDAAPQSSTDHQQIACVPPETNDTTEMKVTPYARPPIQRHSQHMNQQHQTHSHAYQQSSPPPQLQQLQYYPKVFHQPSMSCSSPLYLQRADSVTYCPKCKQSSEHMSSNNPFSLCDACHTTQAYPIQHNGGGGGGGGGGGVGGGGGRGDGSGVSGGANDQTHDVSVSSSSYHPMVMYNPYGGAPGIYSPVGSATISNNGGHHHASNPPPPPSRRFNSARPPFDTTTVFNRDYKSHNIGSANGDNSSERQRTGQNASYDAGAAPTMQQPRFTFATHIQCKYDKCNTMIRANTAFDECTACYMRINKMSHCTFTIGCTGFTNTALRACAACHQQATI